MGACVCTFFVRPIACNVCGRYFLWLTKDMCCVCMYNSIESNLLMFDSVNKDSKRLFFFEWGITNHLYYKGGV